MYDTIFTAKYQPSRSFANVGRRMGPAGENFRKSLQLNPKNENARKKLEQLGAH